MNLQSLNGFIPTTTQTNAFEEWHVLNVLQPIFSVYEGEDVWNAYESVAPLAESHDGLVLAMTLWLGANVEFVDDSDNGVVRGVHYGGVELMAVTLLSIMFFINLVMFVILFGMFLFIYGDDK